MAAKAKVKPKAKVKAKAKTTNKARGRPKGLQLSTAQWKAYSHAAAIVTNTYQIKRRRLAAVYAMQKKYTAAHAATRRAAIAAHATQMSVAQSRIGHQNAALQARLQHNMGHHVQALNRLQYAQAGEKAFLHQAVMRTVTNAQARSQAISALNRAAKVARAASKSTRKTPNKPLPAAVLKAARAAGLKAAKSTKPGVSGRKRGRPKGATGKAKQAAVSQRKAAAQSKKAPVKKAKGRTAPPPWAGNEHTPNCVVTAIANHLLYARGIQVSAEALAELTQACAAEPKIEDVLWQVWLSGWPNDGIARLHTYLPVTGEDADSSQLVIGFDVQTDDGVKPHAALSLEGDEVVSWGSVMTRTTPVEEAWDLQWRVYQKMW